MNIIIVRSFNIIIPPSTCSLVLIWWCRALYFGKTTIHVNHNGNDFKILFAFGIVGGKIFMMGGVSTVANRTLSSVECYDAVNDVWIHGVQELPHPSRWLSCLAVSGKI